jgi:acid stress-induced BolA-like protein IbaG/YrbA
MNNDEIKALLAQAFSDGEIHISGDGYHAQAIVVSSEFEGLRSIKRQQRVYEPLMAAIGSGSLHALSIKAFTPTEWQRERKLLMPS